MNNITFFILTHGNLCNEFYELFIRLTGTYMKEHMIPIPLLDSMTKEDYYNLVRSNLINKEEFIFLTDIPGGTPDIVAKMLVHSENKGYVISGINIPLMVNIINMRRFDSIEEFTEKLISAGKNGIQKFHISR